MYEPNTDELNEQFHKKGFTGVNVDVDEMDITFYQNEKKHN